MPCPKCNLSQVTTSRQCVGQDQLIHIVNIQQEEAFLGTLHHGTGSIDKWEETLLINGEFKIDTEADISVVSESTFQQLQGVTLQPATTPLSGAEQQTLPVSERFMGALTHKTNVIKDERPC